MFAYIFFVSIVICMLRGSLFFCISFLELDISFQLVFHVAVFRKIVIAARRNFNITTAQTRKNFDTKLLKASPHYYCDKEFTGIMHGMSD